MNSQPRPRGHTGAPGARATLALGAILASWMLAACAGAATTAPTAVPTAPTAVPAPGATLAPTPDPTPTPTLAPTPEPTPAPVRTPPRATIPVPTAVRSTPAPSASFVAIPAAIIQTPWGRAWDRIPAGFPLPSDAQAADPGDPTQGPSSAVYVSGQAVNPVVTIVEQGIRSLGLTVEGIAEGEDGSVAIGLVGTPAACRAQVVVRPLGSTTFITVYYGSRCARP